MRDLLEVLNNYNINGTILTQTRGPLLEIIEFEPAAGTKLKNIAAVTEDIRRELGVSSLRIEPAQAGNAVLFQIPAQSFDIIDFKKLLDTPQLHLQKKHKPCRLLWVPTSKARLSLPIWPKCRTC